MLLLGPTITETSKKLLQYLQTLFRFEVHNVLV
jgi:hypothetical protein